MKTIPLINGQQTQILFLLYKFRFLTVNQLLKYFNHKYPSRIREWLKDLKEKKYISAIVDETDPTKPHIYCLSTKAKYILQKDEDCDKSFLERLYKENKTKEKFRNHCFLLLIYICTFYRNWKKIQHFIF